MQLPTNLLTLFGYSLSISTHCQLPYVVYVKAFALTVSDSNMPVSVSGNVQLDEGEWEDHDAKRRKVSLRSEMLESQADSMRK